MVFSNDGTQPFDPGVAASPAPATNAFSGGGAAPGPGEPMVFVGYTQRYSPGRDAPIKAGPKFVPISAFLSGMSEMTRDEFLKLRNLMVAAGVVSPEASPLEVESMMERVVERVASTTTPSTRLSPLGYIKNMARLNGVDPDEVGEETLDPNRTETQTYRSVSEITEGQAWASLQGTLSQMLGRDPSDQELRDFTYRMNQMAASNPQITKTVQQYKDGSVASQSSTTDPGFTAQDVAQEAYTSAQNDPEYAEFTAATTYFSALQTALGAIGG